RRAAAHYEEAALFGQATPIAERLGQSDLVAELRHKRGRALADVGRWTEARPELEAALELLGPEQAERRAAVLADLSEVCFLLLDTTHLRLHAHKLVALAETIGRSDLAIAVFGWLTG